MRLPAVLRKISREPVAVAVAVGLAVAYGVLHAHAGDVRVYRAGGQAIIGGSDLYALRVGDYGFTYPPFAAALFATVAWLPLALMFALLTAGSAAALYVVLRRSAPDLDGGLPAAAGPALLALTQPVIATLAWGQIDVVLAALVLHDLLVRRSGVLVGIAAAIKLTPAVFVLHLALCGRRREARTAVLTFVGASAVGAIVSPTASWRYWTHDVFAGSGIGGFDHVGNQSVRGLAERAVGSGPGTAVWLVAAVPLLAIGLVLARRAARKDDEVLAAGIAGVTACLVSPVAWIHHWVWCVPCLTRLPRVGRIVLGALVVLPLTFGHVLGAGYPILALAAFAVGWRRMAEPTPRDHGTFTSVPGPSRRPSRHHGAQRTAAKLRDASGLSPCSRPPEVEPCSRSSDADRDTSCDEQDLQQDCRALFRLPNRPPRWLAKGAQGCGSNRSCTFNDDVFVGKRSR